MRLTDIVRKLGRRRYGKVAAGPDILSKAGVAMIRAECPHFARWLAWLEGLG
jgi:hypothetical protein